MCHVFIMAAACVLETSLFLICAFFINMRVPDMPSTVCPRLVVSSRRAATAPAGPQQSCLHTLDESQLPFSYYNTPFSYTCLDTVAKATTYDHFLFGIIYQ